MSLIDQINKDKEEVRNWPNWLKESFGMKTISNALDELISTCEEQYNPEGLDLRGEVCSPSNGITFQMIRAARNELSDHVLDLGASRRLGWQEGYDEHAALSATPPDLKEEDQ